MISSGDFNATSLLGNNETEWNVQLHLLDNKNNLQILFSYS